MTYAPRTLSDLLVYWRAQGGVPLGVVGNKAHTKGYHLGRDRIYDGSGPGLGDADYSVQLRRDKAGLSDAASAIDLGRLDGTLGNLREFSRWLVARAQADRWTYRDIREIIYSPDGVKVQRWSGEDNQIHTGQGNGDSSHLTHTHISFYRDSERRDKRPMFAPFFADVAPPDTSAPGEVVKSFPVYEARYLAKVADLAWLYDNSALARSDGNVQITPARDLVYVGTYSEDVRIVAYEPTGADANISSRAMFVRASDLSNIRPDPNTMTQAEHLAAVKAAVAKYRAVVDARTTALRAIAAEAADAATTPPTP